MKNKILILIGMAFFAFTGCEKESTAGLSKTTYYANLELLGTPFSTIPVNGTFTDPGIIATSNGENIPFDVVGSVDNTTPGVYIIEYIATNPDGFKASVKRWVGVIDAAAAANDLSGKYQRTAYGANTSPAGIATWTKVMDGLYTNSDIGGVGAGTIAGNPGYGAKVYVFNVEGDDIIMPEQPNALGGVVYAISETGDERVVFTQGAAGTESYKWSVRGAGYGTPPRTFTKQ